MPLHVRSDEVADLAAMLVKLTGKSKTEAVRDALSEAVEKQRKMPSFMDKIAELQSKVKADGFRSMPDQKEFSDDLSGGI